MTIAQSYREFAIKAHSSTRHFYSEYIPYRYHLEMVNAAFHKFKYLLGNDGNYFQQIVEAAAWGHDMIEDCRITYNDVVNYHPLGKEVADIIYALTNEKGKTRSERANNKYYEGIKNTEGAIFVKLCDRIANVTFGLGLNSSMVKKYKEEGPSFREHLYDVRYNEMFNYLDELYKQVK